MRHEESYRTCISPHSSRAPNPCVVSGRRAKRRLDAQVRGVPDGLVARLARAASRSLSRASCSSTSARMLIWSSWAWSCSSLSIVPGPARASAVSTSPSRVEPPGQSDTAASPQPAACGSDSRRGAGSDGRAAPWQRRGDPREVAAAVSCLLPEDARFTCEFRTSTGAARGTLPRPGSAGRRPTVQSASCLP